MNRSAANRGFTLVEVLVAIAILATVMAIVAQTFFTTLRAWNKGSALADELHHGDFVMEQLVSALRSAAHFKNAPEKYGFWLEDGSGGRYPADKISWVKSGTAFMPDDSPLSHGLHRIELTIGENESGDDAVSVWAYPHLADLDEIMDDEPWFISSVVKGLNCRVYNGEQESWEDEWEDTNQVPALVEISLYMDPLDEFEPPVVIKHFVQIPVGVVLTQAVDFSGTTSSGGAAGGAAGEATDGGGAAKQTTKQSHDQTK